MKATARRPRSSPGGTPRVGACRVDCIDAKKVAAARSAAPPDEEILRLADRFSALADPTRVRILHALCREELCVCDLSQVAGRSVPATSQQLQLLRRLGLVTFRMDGKLAYYRLADQWVEQALEAARAREGAGLRASRGSARALATSKGA